MIEPREKPIFWQSQINIEDAQFIKKIAYKWSEKALRRLNQDLEQGGIYNSQAHLRIIYGMDKFLPVFTETLERAMLGRVIRNDEETPTSSLESP